MSEKSDGSRLEPLPAIVLVGDDASTPSGARSIFSDEIREAQRTETFRRQLPAPSCSEWICMRPRALLMGEGTAYSTVIALDALRYVQQGAVLLVRGTSRPLGELRR
ncbi:hypothetical protein K488DRAFT_72203 [Vararia minispora EC-137]|uniref:Uncharacterized protein n=1 Tax=Vararia minispora EC-137 TaxID=1314806 RepID=A0ACB8QFQ3_9AGAM|nr:hypothetical protein K488DRAFT_72203 [Vararia minispora EC-137]